MKTIKLVLVMLFSIIISSCGGGGGATSTPAAIPSAPTNVMATAGVGQVTISWTAVNGANSYNLYMATQSGVTKSSYSTLTGGMTHPSVTSPYDHTGLTIGTAYYFVVTAVNASGESVESTEVSATPVPPACQTNNTADVRFYGGSLTGATHTVVWDGVAVATVAPGQYTPSTAQAAGVQHTITFSFANGTPACTTAYVVLTQCSIHTYWCGG